MLAFLHHEVMKLSILLQRLNSGGLETMAHGGSTVYSYDLFFFFFYLAHTDVSIILLILLHNLLTSFIFYFLASPLSSHVDLQKLYTQMTLFQSRIVS